MEPVTNLVELRFLWLTDFSGLTKGSAEDNWYLPRPLLPSCHSYFPTSHGSCLSLRVTCLSHLGKNSRAVGKPGSKNLLATGMPYSRH